MKKAIINANVVTENGIIWDAKILIRGGKILDFGEDIEIPSDTEIIDARGAYAGPGFVDIHVHEGGGYSTCFEPQKAAEFFLSHGETSILATPSYDLNFDEMMRAIKTIKSAMPNTPSIKGMYMEGPYMNPEYGSHAYQNPWRYQIREDEFKALVDEAGLDAKIWAIAPEREGILPFLAYAREVNPDTVFAVGHSEALPSQIRSLGKYRPTLQTHSMNATGRIPVYGGTRSFGPDEYCFKEMDVYCELISDSKGIHVNSEMQQLLLHTKGVHRTVLITDSTVYDEPTPKEFSHITDLNFDAQGGIAGSKLTMDVACRNIMSHTNCGIAQTFIMASLNPAKVLGMDDEIGSIEVGKRADIVLVDDKFNVQQVIAGGEIV